VVERNDTTGCDARMPSIPKGLRDSCSDSHASPFTRFASSYPWVCTHG
jgi:hypothetical protein